MKQCPNCQITYADDSLQFCLQDGTPLVEFSSQSASDFETEPETLVIPKKVEPIRFDLPSSYKTNQTNQSDWQPSQPLPVKRETKKSNTAKVVILSVLGTILLLGLGGLGTWLYFNNKKTQVTVNNVNTSRTNRPANANAANNQNQNVNVAVPSPSITPTASPTIDAEKTKEIAGDVKDVVDDWKNASENLDIDSHLSYYADSVDYYRGGTVGIKTVRADKERAYSIYDSIDINIKNLKITPDATGEKATALFDKEWRFEGDGKFSAGEVQQQLTLSKIKGRWLITGEKDLKVYYTQN